MLKKLLLTTVLAATTLCGIRATTVTDTFTYSYATEKGVLGGYGTAAAETIGAAMGFYTPSFAGMRLTKIQAYLNMNEEQLDNFSNSHLFISTDLKVDQPGDILDVSVTPVKAAYGNDNDLLKLEYNLPEPYEITKTSVFVGYTLKIDQVNNITKYPILLDKSVTNNPYAFYFYAHSSTSYEWSGASYANGAVIIVLTLERDVQEYALTINSSNTTYTTPDEECYAMLNVSNIGLNPVKEISYTYSINGGEKKSNDYMLEQPIPANLQATYNIMLPIEAPKTPDTYEVDLTITACDGYEYESDLRNTFFILDVLGFRPKHVSMIEEFTSLGCGYCPRGFVALEYINEEYPEDAVLLCYHDGTAFGKDEMATTSNYPVPGASQELPCATLNRGPLIDPYYGDYSTGLRDVGIVDDLMKANAAYTPAEVSVSKVEVADSVINVTTDFRFAKDTNGQGYLIGYVLSCDGLWNASWRQSNYFSHDNDFKNTPLINEFYELPAKVGGLTYNFVVINNEAGRGVAESVPREIKGGEVYQHNYSFDVHVVQNQFKENMYPWVNIDRMVVNAFIIDRNNGAIVNACKFKVGQVYDGVESVLEDADADVAPVYYNLQGQRVLNPDRGLYIEVRGNKATKVVK